MKKIIPLFLILLLGATLVQSVNAQAPLNFRGEFMGQFNYSANRILALAEAMPADKYSWSPGEGVMSVERVYMHIARYNYYYPESSLGIAAPEGLEVATMEEITGKEAVVEHLRNSLAHVKELAKGMSEEDLSKEAELYGRNVQAWSVLLQLVAHMNEHVGQSIAYARMNGVVPPWSK